MTGMKAGKGNSPKVLVLGVGNLLLGDDGVGVHLIKSLEGTQFPENVRLLDAGTVSHRLITLFHSVGYLIIIDAVEAGDRPGSIFRFSPDDVNLPSKQKLSLHPMVITDIKLKIGEMSGVMPSALEFLFHIASKGTIAEGAVLHIEHIPLTARCSDCSETFRVKDYCFKCASCRGGNFRIIAGRELLIEEVEVDDIKPSP